MPHNADGGQFMQAGRGGRAGRPLPCRQHGTLGVRDATREDQFLRRTKRIGLVAATLAVLAFVIGAMAAMAQATAPTTTAMPAATVDTGDTAWVLTSAALVLLMTTGLAFFYGGMVRSKSVLNMIMMSLGAMAVV